MICPSCREEDSAVLETRRCSDGTRRLRKCKGCGAKWATVEINTARLAAYKAQEARLGQIRTAMREFANKMGWDDL